MITDMTVGKPDRILWRFSVPMLISVVFQQMYNIADGIIAGKYVGENALAAVGASYPITMIFMAIAVGSNIGCSVVISQLFGAKRYKDMKTAISTTFIACLALSLGLMVIGLIFCSSMMIMINTPENIFADSELYLRIYIIGLSFLFFYNICTGIFTALGDSKTPLYFLIGSSIANVFLDILFVAGFKMGVAGVAWATFIAQGVSSALSLITLYIRIKSVKCEKPDKLFSGKMLKRISVLAVPSILQQSFISIGNLMIQALINGYGSAVIAGYSSAIKLNTFAITSFTTLANGLSNFTAQNIGANKIDRIYEGFKAGFVLVMSIVLPFFIAFFVFSSNMLGFFMKEESQSAIQIGSQFLKIVSPFYFVVSIKLIADGVLRGAGAMRYFMIATFMDLIIRVVLSYILAYYFGTIGIWLSWPIGWTTAAILSYSFYKSDVWRKDKAMQNR